uniref:Ly-6/neurotoxin-like protein 1 n=1 Tax=Felis catus TaxID=9685 RepID=A0ABI7VUQ6_FELCA
MAPLLTLFLVALVGLPLAQALDCHVCAYNGENCFNPMRCPAMVTYCMTTRTYYTPTRMKVSKSCVPSCFETVYDGYSKHASTTSCCQYDLCNSAGLAVPGALALAPILLATVWGEETEAWSNDVAARPAGWPATSPDPHRPAPLHTVFSQQLGA